MSNIRTKTINFSIEAYKATAAEMLAQRSDHNSALRFAMVGVYKSLSRGVIFGLGRQLGGKYIGMGAEQIAYGSDNGDVIKLLRWSIGTDLSEARRLSLENQRLSDTAQTHLEAHWTDTVFYPTRMPSIIGGYAVAAVQPRIIPTHTFETAEKIVERSPSSASLDDLSDFVEKIRQLHSKTGMYPDLLGPGNLVLASSSSNLETLSILDTIPETPLKLTSFLEDGVTTRKCKHDEIVSNLEEFAAQPRLSSGSREAALR